MTNRTQTEQAKLDHAYVYAHHVLKTLTQVHDAMKIAAETGVKNARWLRKCSNAIYYQGCVIKELEAHGISPDFKETACSGKTK